MHAVRRNTCYIGLLMAILYTTLVWTAQAEGDSRFDFPIGPPYTPLGTRVTEVDDRDGWYVIQEFGTPNLDGKRHLGEDWNSERGAFDDLGKPIYAAASGTVIYAGNAGAEWNGVIIIHHQAPSGAPFVLPDGRAVLEVWTLYGHLDVARIHDWVVKDHTISKSAQIGVIGPTPAGSTGPHLHFEIRYANPPNLVGPGYSVDTAGWVDPSDFIDLNRPCHMITSSTPLDSIPQGFGVPWDVFNPSIMEMTAACSGSVARIDMNATPNPQYQYRNVYNIGYSAQPGAASWTPFTLTGEGLISNAWLPGRGTVSISLQDTAKPTYVLGYICTWTGSQWKCGCRDTVCAQSYWQMQRVSK